MRGDLPVKEKKPVLCKTLYLPMSIPIQRQLPGTKKMLNLFVAAWQNTGCDPNVFKKMSRLGRT